MAPPVLNVRLALEHPDREGDGLGGYRIEWRHLGWLWAAMAARSGVQRQAEVSAESVVTWQITLRAAPVGDVRRPAPGQRFRLDQRLFVIEAVAEQDRAGRWLTCFAKEEELA